MRLEVTIQTVPPNGRPPDPPPSPNRNKNYTERTCASSYIILTRQHRGILDSGRAVGKIRKPPSQPKSNDRNRICRARSHLEKINHGSKFLLNAPIGRYIIPSRRYRANTVRKNNGGKTSDYRLSIKSEDGNAIYSVSFHLEVDVNSSSRTSTAVPTEEERSPRENTESIQEIKRNLQRLEENQSSLNLQDNTNKIDYLLHQMDVSMNWMVTTIESWISKSTRRAGIPRIFGRMHFPYWPVKTQSQEVTNLKPQDFFTASHNTKRLGCGIKVDHAALTLAISSPSSLDLFPDTRSAAESMPRNLRVSTEGNHNGSDTVNLGVEYLVPLPWPQDRPPDK